MLVLGQCEEVQKHEHDQNFNANFLSHPKNGTSGKYELILYIIEINMFSKLKWQDRK